MSNIHFFPRLNETLLEQCGYKTKEYSFAYNTPDGSELQLQLDGRKSSRLCDSADTWQVEEDGLIVEKTIVIEYPEVLKGPNGIISENARLLPCLLWSCPKLSTAGSIRPSELIEEPRLAARFRHFFKPGSIDGSIILKPVLYIGQSASELKPGEEFLMNEAGVLLGDIEQELLVDFTGDSENFPIGEFDEEGGPLWLMQFEDWDDPREDPFSSSSFILLVNSKHPDCPKRAAGQIQNETLLMEVLSEAYFLLYEKVRDFHDDAVWNDMMTGSNLAPDSICSVLHWFSQRGDFTFDWSTPESRMLSIKRIIDQSLSEGGSSE